MSHGMEAFTNSWSTVGLDIGRQLPIHGTTATNQECKMRTAAVRAVLTDNHLPTKPGPSHQWFTAELVDGTTAGIWAESPQEAIIELALWRGQAVVEIHRDPDAQRYKALQAGKAFVELTLF